MSREDTMHWWKGKAEHLQWKLDALEAERNMLKASLALSLKNFSKVQAEREALEILKDYYERVTVKLKAERDALKATQENDTREFMKAAGIINDLEARIARAEARKPSILSVAMSPDYKEGYGACLNALKPSEESE